MIKTLDECVERLPQFVIPDPSAVIFVTTYSKYETATLDNKSVQNEKGAFLSRIPKKNGKHRYYLSEEVVINSGCNGCGEEKCKSEYCGRTIYDYGFASKYVGKDLHNALLELFTETTK